MKHQYSEDFERFWKAYPKREGNPKFPAWKEWEKAQKQSLAEPDQIIAAALRYAQHLRQPDNSWLTPAHARTWLHQRRWEDYSEQDQATPPEMPRINATDADWKRALYQLSKEIGAPAFNAWFSEALFLAQPYEMIVKSQFFKDRIASNYQPRLEQLLGKSVRVKVDAEACEIDRWLSGELDESFGASESGAV